MHSLNIGVIGAGRIGKLHTNNILKHLPQLKIKAIADPQIDTAWAKSLSIPVITHDFNDLINDNTIQAVLICSPSSQHAPQIIAAAQAGKHIFCEKPISTDIEQIKSALQAVAKSGVKFQVGFNRRFDPNFAKIKQMLTANRIGTPQLLRITSRDPKIPPTDYIKSSGGMFIDMTIHDFDMARFLMNSEVTEVYASANALINPIIAEHGDIDTAIINLKFANGSLGVIDNSRQAVYGYDQRVEVFGSEGAVQADNNTPTNTTLSTLEGITTEKPLYFFLERYEVSFVAELTAFYESIANNTKPAVTGEDGLRSVILSIAAEQSRRENRPISIDYQEWGA